MQDQVMELSRLKIPLFFAYDGARPAYRLPD
jgi:hypothetical protein